MRRLLLSIVLGLLLFWTVKPAWGQTKTLVEFQKATPAERGQLVAKVLKETDLHRIDKGKVVHGVLERAILEAVRTANVICTAKSSARGQVVSTIRWVIDDGSTVKKGEKLLELDDSLARERIKTQKVALAQAAAELVRAREDATRVRAENEADIRLGEIEVKLADLDAKKYKGDDAVTKEVLQLKIERARLKLERSRSQCRSKEVQADAEREAKRVLHEQQLELLRELEEQVARHTILAPMDGLVHYYISESWRGPNPRGLVVAQGETVTEGQRLLMVSDLKQMAAVARVPEASVALLRTGQKAQVRVDAYFGRKFDAEVREVSNVADLSASYATGVKVYAVKVAFNEENTNTRPGMSADVWIPRDEKANCLRIPASAMFMFGRDRLCYVSVGNELHERKLTVGVLGADFAEVLAGLTEGEVVLQDVYGVLRRLSAAAKKR